MGELRAGPSCELIWTQPLRRLVIPGRAASGVQLPASVVKLLTGLAASTGLAAELAAGWIAPTSGGFAEVLRSALMWACSSSSSPLRLLQLGDWDAAPITGGNAGTHWRHKVPLTAFLRSVKEESPLSGLVDAMIAVGPIWTTASRASGTRFDHALSHIKTSQAIPDGALAPESIAQWISRTVLPVPLTLVINRVAGIISWYRARSGYRSGEGGERREAFSLLFPLLRVMPEVASVVRFLTPCAMEADQIVYYGKMCHSLCPEVSPWSLDAMRTVETKVSDAKDGFMFICNEEDLNIPVGDCAVRVTRLCDLLALSESQRAATARGAASSVPGEGPADVDRTALTGLQMVVKVQAVRAVQTRVLLLSTAAVRQVPQIFFEIFSVRYAMLSAIMLGRLKRTAATAPVCEIAEQHSASMAEYLSFFLFRDPDGIRPAHTFKWTLPDKVLNLLRMDHKERFMEVRLLQLAAVVRSVKERVPCCKEVHHHKHVGDCLKSPSSWFVEEMHFSLLEYLVPLWQAFGFVEDSVMAADTWRYAIDALSKFWRKGASLGGEMYADHLANVRTVFRAIQEDVYRTFSIFSRVVYPDPLEQVPTFLLANSLYGSTLGSLTLPINNIFEMGEAFPALGRFLAGASDVSQHSKRKRREEKEERVMEDEPPPKEKKKGGGAKIIGSAVGMCKETAKEVRFGSTVFDKALIYDKLNRNEGNCCLPSFLCRKKGARRFSACQRANQKAHSTLDSEAHYFSSAMEAMRESFEQKPFRKDKGARSSEPASPPAPTEVVKTD